MEFEELYEQAKAVLAPKRLSPWAESGGVGAAILTKDGNVYRGVCIDTGCSMGFCAEHAAAAAMITAGEDGIEEIVAGDWGGKGLPPCGRCREFLSQLAEENRNAQVLVKEGVVVTLEQLLPWDWREAANNNSQ